MDMAANKPDNPSTSVAAGQARRLSSHYGVFVLIYTLYGYQVCPYLDDLTLPQIMFPAIGAILLHWALRTTLLRQQRSRINNLQSSWQFRFDLGGFLVLGTALAAYNFIVFGFPPGSGGKVFFGFAVLGTYIAMDLALNRDLKMGERLRSQGKVFAVNEQFMPYQTKFLLFSGLNILVVASVGLLVAMKDLTWALSATQETTRIQGLVLMDMTFVVAIVGGYIMLVVRQYSAKIAFSLSEETKTLQAVSDGDLASRVTVVSNDEFGQVAVLTNAMIGQLQKSLDEVSRSRSAIIQALVALAAKRDNETGLHLKRTQSYVELLCSVLAKTENLQDALSADTIADIVQAAPLHDIGKVGVPDAILRKPGRLDDQEYEVMKTHAALGASALEEADAILGGSPFIQTAIDIAIAHHERWDGKGYPYGLAGEQIPLAARIMAVADVYDALRSKRVYKPAMEHEQARSILMDGAGTQFDPTIVAAFIAVEQNIACIADDLSDSRSRHGNPKDQIAA